MLSGKPRFGIVFSLLAGFIMLVVWVGTIIGGPIDMIELADGGLWFWKPSLVLRLGFVIGWAVLILIWALVLYFAPRRHFLGGTIILTFSSLALLLWVGGYILRRFMEFYRGYYSPFPFPFLLGTDPLSGGIRIFFFDLLVFASIFGVVGGVLGVLWEPKSVVASVKQLKAEYNLLGVVSAILAFNSLALPWWVVDGRVLDPLIFPWGQDGVSMGALGWWYWITEFNYDKAMYAAVAFILISGVLALLGCLVVGRKGRFLLFTAGLFAVLSVVTFAGTLQSFLQSLKVIQQIFGFERYLSFGFWAALAAAILAFIASFRHLPTPSKAPSS